MTEKMDALVQADKACWLSLPREVRRRGMALLDQQMWCWGHDVRQPEGNVLVQYGFTKQRPPEGTKGSSAYLLPLEQGFVTLWGWGLCYGDGTETLFLERYGFAPRLLRCGEPPVGVWQRPALPHADVPRSVADCEAARQLTVCALEWISGYERWAWQAAGAAHRQRCVAEWWKERIAAEEMAEAWAALAEVCRALPTRYEDGKRTAPPVERRSAELKKEAIHG